jgi:hypothetical protein
MKNVVIAGAFLLVSACGTPVLAQNQYVTIQTLTAIHDVTTIIDGIPYDPEVDGGDSGGAQFATRKDKVTVKATFTNNIPGYFGKYKLTSGSTIADAEGALDIDSVFRFDHKGKAGTRTYYLSVWMEHGVDPAAIGLKSQNSACK